MIHIIDTKLSSCKSLDDPGGRTILLFTELKITLDDFVTFKPESKEDTVLRYFRITGAQIAVFDGAVLQMLRITNHSSLDLKDNSRRNYPK